MFNSCSDFIAGLLRQIPLFLGLSMQIIDLKQQPQHIPAIAAWHFAEWAHLNPGRTQLWLEQHMQCYLADAFIPSMFIALDDESQRVLGTSSLIAHDLAERPDLTPWLANVYVDASQRGKGLGRQLVVHAMQQAKQAEINTLYLFTPDQQAFYARLGWQYLCTEYLHGHAETVMQVSLADWPAPL
jgi:predicted N-acetyltransferase YhbS